MEKLPKTHVEFCNMLYCCIDFEYLGKCSLLDCIISETGKNQILEKDVEKWLRGLPSACTIPFRDFEIYEILKSCGNSQWSIDDYWKFAASRVLQFAKKPKLYI
jgi:hypothetical protein